MSAFIGQNAYLWQKIAVNVRSDTTLEALHDALRFGATFFLIRFGLHTTRECELLIDRCNEAIRNYVKECEPWNVSVGVICELSGPQPRVKFGGDKNIAKATVGQMITFTHDARYENQLFAEVKYVTNFNQLNLVTVGNVLSIGQVLLTAERIVPGHLTCRTLQGGTFASCSCVELVNRAPSNPWKEDPACFSSAILNECKIILEKGCRFVVLPSMKKSASYRATLEAIRLTGLDRQFVHLVANCDDKLELINGNEIGESFDALLVNDVETLVKAKAQKYAVILHLTTGQFPQCTEEADTIAVDICNLTVLHNYLRLVNQERLRCDGVVKKGSSIGPEDNSLVKCVHYASREAECSAVILCYAKSVSLPMELATQDILRIVFVIVRTSGEAAKLLLRKYLIPIAVPQRISSQERMIRLAIAFGKRFGYLHDGNCVVAGFTAAPEPDFGMELRYVPPMGAGY